MRKKFFLQKKIEKIMLSLKLNLIWCHECESKFVFKIIENIRLFNEYHPLCKLFEYFLVNLLFA